MRIEFPKSRPIIITPYREDWPAEFARLEADLHTALGDIALRIDHIGSTSIPGLSAKDTIVNFGQWPNGC
jgi:GrpB-like predicted nucleotidyltransferase (UPF0157 family)